MYSDTINITFDFASVFSIDMIILKNFEVLLVYFHVLEIYTTINLVGIADFYNLSFICLADFCI
jgi:hypothetical protein